MLDNTAGASDSLFDRIVMTSPPRAAPDTSVMDAIALMHQARSGYVVVLNRETANRSADWAADWAAQQAANRAADRAANRTANRRQSLLGIFTERDLVRAVAADQPLEKMSLVSILTSNLPSITPEQISSATDIFLLMRQQRTHYLTVVDSLGKFIGMIDKQSLRKALSATSRLKLKSVSEAMIRQVFCLPTSSSVLQSAQLMLSKRVSCIVILNKRALPVGIITERDIVQFKALNLDIRCTIAQQVMSTPLLPLLPEDSLLTAHQKMSHHRVRRLVVQSSESALAGLITQTSILQALSADDSQHMMEILQQEVLQLRFENQALLADRNRELESDKVQLSTQLENKHIEQQQTKAQLKAAYQALEKKNRALTTTNRALTKTLRELRSAEQALQQANAELESRVETRTLDRMKGEFVGVISHELRTPLTTIHGGLQLITSGLVASDSGQGKDLLQVAAKSSLRLVKLVNDILELERLESGKVRLAREKTDAQSVAYQVARTFEALAQEKRINLAVEATRLWAFADSDRLIQVLTHLIDNAIKFSPEDSTIRISIEKTIEQAIEQAIEKTIEQPAEKTIEQIVGDAIASSSTKTMALFKVEDQGRGIPPENLSRIFERFTQVNYSDTREKGGTGLGLAICYNIVSQHGGRMWVESTFDQGSCFCFTLPLFRE